ncbi:MAG: AtpZ/AtpI family protein [Bacteroidota bacterium]
MTSGKEFRKLSTTYSQIGPYLGLGTQLAATVVLMFFLGRWLDYELSTTPLFIILFSLIGSSAGIYSFIKAVLNLNKKKSLEK